MPKRRKPDPKRPSTPKASKPKRKPPMAALVSRRESRATKAEVETALDELVDLTNLTVKRSDLEKNAGADLLFRRLFANESTAALDLARHPSPAYVRMRARAGHSLLLDSDELSIWVRIGALNHRLSTAAWVGLAWSVKEELLALVDPADPNLEKLRKGVTAAARGGMTLEDVREWKRVNFPQRAGTGGRPATFTLAAGKRFAATGTRLASQRDRQRFAEVVRAAPVEARRALVNDLRATVDNLGLLLEAIGDDSDA